MINSSNKYVLAIHLNRVVAIIVFLLISSSAWAEKEQVFSPLPSIVSEQWQDFEHVGQTSLRRFGFHVYDSSFWMINKQQANEQFNSTTCALSITYARNISVEQLLSNTKKEWLRLGFADQYPLDNWLTILSGIWSDVSKGDQLVFVSDAKGSSSFYSKDQRLGTIEDRDFGSAFLSIWLSENARFKKNRKELLGE